MEYKLFEEFITLQALLKELELYKAVVLSNPFNRSSLL